MLRVFLSWLLILFEYLLLSLLRFNNLFLCRNLFLTNRRAFRHWLYGVWMSSTSFSCKRVINSRFSLFLLSVYSKQANHSFLLSSLTSILCIVFRCFTSRLKTILNRKKKTINFSRWSKHFERKSSPCGIPSDTDPMPDFTLKICPIFPTFNLCVSSSSSYPRLDR